MGRRISATDQDNKQTVFFYDAEGRLVYTVDAAGDVTLTWWRTVTDLRVRASACTPPLDAMRATTCAS